MHLLAEYGLFLAKTITIVIAILLILSKIISAKAGSKESDDISIQKINASLTSLQKKLQNKILDKKSLKRWTKQQKKTADQNKDNDKTKSRLFILKFKGDMQASQVDNLRREVTATLLCATEQDEVLVCLESPGGVVPSYGLAASQLARIRAAHIPLTVAVDKVAASGGYMMASVANTILAAPFAIIGSIGVVAQLPNFHRLLDKNDVDFEQITAGQYKRTLSLFGKNTDEGRDKMQEEINLAHDLFKDHIKQFRENLDIDQVATGEYWYGSQALALNLIDAIQTSDDYILQQRDSVDLFLIQCKIKLPAIKKLLQQAQLTWHQLRHPSILMKK